MNCLLLCNQNKRSGYKNRTYLRATLIKDYLYIKDFAELLQRDKGGKKKRFTFGNPFFLPFWGWLSARREVRIFPFLSYRQRHKISVTWPSSLRLGHADPLGHRPQVLSQKSTRRKTISRSVLGIWGCFSFLPFNLNNSSFPHSTISSKTWLYDSISDI